MRLTEKYYNYKDGWNIHRSMLRPQNFVDDITEAEYLLLSTYDISEMDFELLSRYNLKLKVDCSTEIAPPEELLDTIPVKDYTLYCNSVSDNFILNNPSVSIIEEPFFLKYNHYYTPKRSKKEIKKKKFLYMVGKAKFPRVCLLGLLSYYNLLDDAHYSYFGDGELNMSNEININYFETEASEIQKKRVRVGLNEIKIPTILDVAKFDYNVSHSREFNADFYDAVDFVIVPESHINIYASKDAPLFITEKIGKCIRLDKKFILLGECGLLKYTKEQAKIHLGKDISHLTDWCDTSYDDIPDLWERIDKIIKIVYDKSICIGE